MIKHILVPFDFSPHATDAFRLALTMARKCGATVHLLNVIELPVLDGPMLIPLYDYENPYYEEVRAKTEEKFSKIKETFHADGITVISKTEFGRPAHKILATITAESIDLVIMGAQGLSDIAEFFMGSITAKVVRNSPVPVMILNHYSTGELKNIVFPTTGEVSHQETLVSHVKNLQEFFQAALHIVYINTPLNFSSDVVTYQKLDAFAVHFGMVNYTLHIYNHLKKGEGIRQFTKQIKGDMIAIGTHGRNGISTLVNGNLTGDIVEHASLPIWTFLIDR